MKSIEYLKYINNKNNLLISCNNDVNEACIKKILGNFSSIKKNYSNTNSQGKLQEIIIIKKNNSNSLKNKRKITKSIHKPKKTYKKENYKNEILEKKIRNFSQNLRNQQKNNKNNLNSIAVNKKNNLTKTIVLKEKVKNFNRTINVKNLNSNFNTINASKKKIITLKEKNSKQAFSHKKINVIKNNKNNSKEKIINKKIKYKNILNLRNHFESSEINVANNYNILTENNNQTTIEESKDITKLNIFSRCILSPENNNKTKKTIIIRKKRNSKRNSNIDVLKKNDILDDNKKSLNFEKMITNQHKNSFFGKKNIKKEKKTKSLYGFKVKSSINPKAKKNLKTICVLNNNSAILKNRNKGYRSTINRENKKISKSIEKFYK